MIRILETPRDAIQGLKTFIPTESKIKYLNAVIETGFDIVDVGSLVSPAAVPQMRDTADIVGKIALNGVASNLALLVGNERGIRQAAGFKNIRYLIYPFSISATFLKLNLNKTVEEAWQTMECLAETCRQSGKEPLIYLSMAFGNPYGDVWNEEIVIEQAARLIDHFKLTYINVCDTTGVASPGSISIICSELSRSFPAVELAIHLHTRSYDWASKLEAAYLNGCTVFDGVLTGIGGCPMTGYNLLSNLKTGYILEFARMKGEEIRINRKAYNKALQIAGEIFSTN
jgi:hydroxymethylglutaryl-CoA lyase